MSRSGEQLRAAIAKLEARLAALDRERDTARARLEALRRDLAGLGIRRERDPSQPCTSKLPRTAGEKVRVFRSLFRGREDVFPSRFVAVRTGRSGYAPACANKFVPGVCKLPRIKCGECPNQAFLPVDDQAVIDHLRGRHVIGVYPLLEDETCWFLAVDFDKGDWQADVGAFRGTCRSAKIPVAVERSRSGNGAHAWFFFSAPVPASVARRMGCHLLTETMARRHQLGMGSYDRLFPNQDTLPRGGFGNLIALPLQYEPRQRGNTVFVDEDFSPYADQWAFLASMARLSPATVEEIARNARRIGRVIGVRFPAAPEDDGDAPWHRPPSGRPRPTRIAGRLPDRVRAVIAQRLFVETAGLPPAMLDRIKRLAAFQNPEFYQKQSLRLSTAGTPRVIACAEQLADHVALPRGCLPDLEELLDSHGVRLALEDERTEGDDLAVSFDGELTPLQRSAAQALLEHDVGVFVAPPGSGKTVVGAHLIARRGRSTLVLVHRRPLLDHWVAQLAMFLGIPEREIGRIGGGKRKPNGRLDVAMIQSLVRKGTVDDAVAGYGHVIVDECHHIPAFSFERVISEAKARYVTGLTATPRRRDGHDPILTMQLGPVRFAADPGKQTVRRPFEHTLIVRETGFKLDGAADLGIQQIYGALAADESRNDLIFDDVIRAVAARRSPILLTERRGHLEALADRLRGFVRHLLVLHGGMNPKQRHEAAQRLATIPDDEERLVIATGRYIGEGFDDPRLDTLFLAMPISWKGTLVQYTGRLHRLHPGKSEVQIFDYVDRDVPVLSRMFEKRLRTYRAIGYVPEEAGGTSDGPRELTIEYDRER